ncbi:uncharacterized protein Ecym_5223 [Eremothecium cymbalariae DBVPG|uniref:Uncharacterized protein n=1 Tax=Eremothecium cymbalariae (strain CBS 270.75 / DBVPG 7215 / KCTC 17166 / NRRL Y-17582) TaxID=931890 RepID=I6ND49_ERECY|nr:hypothetical protein Ecym_5223 [Eremothecium cymbalariae DBVPG\
MHIMPVPAKHDMHPYCHKQPKITVTLPSQLYLYHSGNLRSGCFLFLRPHVQYVSSPSSSMCTHTLYKNQKNEISFLGHRRCPILDPSSTGSGLAPPSLSGTASFSPDRPDYKREGKAKRTTGGGSYLGNKREHRPPPARAARVRCNENQQRSPRLRDRRPGKRLGNKR